MLGRLNDGSLNIEALLPVPLGHILSVDQTDGYRVSFDQQTIVHLRPSGNAPELRCYVEMNNQDKASELCLAVLKKVEELFKSEA